ncbi:alpha/beta hydrolase [Roseovarius spongiae]|uniref:Alpha/beta hydrolase n=1 Tax=Roseovarius spongiae TaxID=2320272 RepID=A0A3A8B5W8_9RHOB|nr:alpha/beta hydrolase [Roseovarius spongiae]RKF16005.1 alpha/beta hydrolase [Roseovarius spongiae]
MSRRAALLRFWLRRTEKRRLRRVQDPARLRRGFEARARLFFRPARGARYRAIRPGDGVEALEVTPERLRGEAIVLFLHGGAYVFGSPHTHKAMLSRLAVLAGVRAVLPWYRLAPEHPFPAALEDALAAYRAVMDHPGGVVLGGDSAGGGLALALLARIRALGLPSPRGCFAFSPLTDMTFGGESIRANAESDVLLPAERAGDMAAMYLAGAPAEDSRASPLNADFTGAPPVWLTASDSEILADDTRRMAARLLEQGVDVTCVIERDLPHVWPLFQTFLPEARQTLAELAGWITSLSRL